MKRNKFSSLIKTFMVAGLAALLVTACNNESDTKTTTDSTPGTAMVTGDTATGAMAPMDTAGVPMVQSAMVNIEGTYPDTAVTGTAKFTAADGKVKMELEIMVPMKAGKSVAVHLHEHGDCGDNGKMSHGHWNPTKEDHGKWGTAPYHRGDIGNVKLDAKGRGTLTVTTDLWTLGGKPDMNILGKALIVHGGVDDYKTQPTGNAGSRIGCGVIK